MENFSWGVDFHGFACAMRQNRVVIPKPPTEYINDSFIIFKQAGIHCIRFPVYWESYETNPEGFNQELDRLIFVASVIVVILPAYLLEIILFHSIQ